MTFKCLSLYPLEATLVAIGAKQVETRSWSTPHRGPLGIHATKNVPKDYQRAAEARIRREPYRSALQSAGIWSYEELPTGAIVSLHRLASVSKIGELVRSVIKSSSRPNEIHFGDYSDGRFAWQLEDGYKLAAPVLTRGDRLLWVPSWDICVKISEQLRSDARSPRVHRGAFGIMSPLPPARE